MPLSEHEQNVLAQMEEAMHAEDPRLADRMAHPSALGRRRRLALAVIGLVAGLGLVVLGVVQQLIWVGVLGFALMVFAPVAAGRAPRHGGADAEQAPEPSSGPSFIKRIEDRWERRRDTEW